MPDSFCPACLLPDTGLSACPHCGWQEGRSRVDALYLIPGTVVNPPYQVARVLGHGGFGITYLGWDANLQIKVAIKEYLPREFAYRAPGGGQVIAYDGDARPRFESGLNSFLDEARVLAKFQQHPGIVSVLAFFRAFGTGYMVMEYVEGQTLNRYLQQHLGRLNWNQTLDIFMQIMDALRAVHKAGMLHRDIAPDNIYLCGDGRVKLLDFGAAQAGWDSLQQSHDARIVMVKPGFAPEEQYRDPREQGPWSDVYSVAASMYYCLTGQAPPDALERLEQDRLKPPSAYGVTIPAAVEQVLLDALAVSSLRRPQTIASLQNQFLSLQAKPAPAIREPRSEPLISRQPPDRLQPVEQGASLPIFHWRRWLLIGFVLVCLWLLAYRLTVNKQADSLPEPLPADHAGSSFEKTDEMDEAGDNAHQRELERQAAEELKRQQAAALQRFEERQRQQAGPLPANPKQPDPRQMEHLRSLCAEWGATMDCENVR
ncbi:serine/threonine protein kinase [Methylomonas sp. LL1]|uniref:serine/threonine protein kinase n=1 Tax=Methylomonas sp. LL1 TaxID=2785785 RepID=UPI0018C3D797|nr:serine/threonine-protein kinase [Methylomonas sp. LL1]QPK63486.1 serine/threonine protein kinase [Methylomonas sp. LL1]